MGFKEYDNQRPAIIIKTTLDLLHQPGEVFEVRIPKTRIGTISGYFNDTGKAAAAIAKENGKHIAIYATVNPINPVLIARNENKFEYGTHTTTNDGDITQRRWFLLDFDPKRPTGISSTDGELQATRDVSDRCLEWLRGEGWPEPLIAESGNGVHFMFRIDEANDDATRIDIENATKMISSMFSTDKVDVDTTVFNAARIWKIYGTVSAKGSNTADRPHRVAKITKLPSKWELLTRPQIEAVGRSLRDAKSDEFRDMTGEFILDMQKWLTDRGMTVSSGPRPMFSGQGQKWEITRCPFNQEHTNPMVGLVNNRPVYRCLHNSCQGYRWKEFREKIDPTYRDPETILARLTEWCLGSEETMDQDLANTAAATGKKLRDLLNKLKHAVPRPRFILAEEYIQVERKRYQRDVIGTNNDRGNLVGLINRTRTYQAEGIVPMFWISDYDHRIRVGPVGDVDCPRCTAEDEISLLIKFHSAGDSWVKQTHCYQVITHLAGEHRVNPLRKWLKRFVWDGNKRLDNWLSHYLGVKDNEYSRSVGRKWLISAVARAMEPGCQADHMLILEGKQGIGKSRALRILGKQFYVEYSGVFSGGHGVGRDMVAVITGKLIVEMSELATLRRGDMETLKAILTTPIDEARLAYERDVKIFPRTCVFSGTTNEIGQAYIYDVTGVRRFWPVHCGEVQEVKTSLLEEDVDQLWAEAVEAYELGEDWWTVPQEIVAEEQMSRQITIEDSDPWFEKIRSSLTDPDSYGSDLFVKMDDYEKGQFTGEIIIRAGQLNKILGVILQVDTSRQTTNDITRLQRILRGIGFVKTRPSKGWAGGTYAYDLKRAALPHLWSVIKEASAQIKFPKRESIDEQPPSEGKGG